MHTIVETEEYDKKSKDLLNEDERESLKEYLAMIPTIGTILSGTGGVRIIYYHSEWMPLFLITIFGKNEKSNLTKAERNDLSKFIPMLIKNYETHHNE